MRKMVFLGGPRQVGKTTLAEQLLKEEPHQGQLLNWDDDNDRNAILGREFTIKKGLLVFDELHKNRRWRNYLKGLFDKQKTNYRILVTGSARLDLYRFGGDSLQGRYYYHRLHPLSVSELKITNYSDLNSLLILSGFPDPYFAQNETEKKRWSNAYRSRLIRDDLRDLEHVTEVSSIELLAQRLPELVGSPLSINSIREDLQAAHATIQKWILLLEKLYYLFRIYPFGPPKVRAVKKLAKHYHFDWTLPSAPGARFENFIASHLLKWCHFKEDCFGEQMELKYYRDSEMREVDFVVTTDNKPILFVETQIGDRSKSPGLRYLKSRYPNIRAVQVSLEPFEPKFQEGIEYLDALRFLQELV